MFGGTVSAASQTRRDDDLVEELKLQGNKLLQSGQTEAAELVYSEALKARRHETTCSGGR
jgi:hypothetical protein